MRGTRRVPISETSHQTVARRLGEADGKMNEAVTMKNRVILNGGGKRQVKKLTRQEFWKYIGCILSAVTYGKKGLKLWSEVSKGVGKYYNLTL